MNIEVITALYFILSGIKILDLIYLFQIKEYRFDRFLSTIHDNGILRTLLGRNKLPAKSPRNILVAAISFTLLALWTYIVYLNPIFLIVSLPIFVLPSLTFVLTGVEISGIIAFIKQKSLVKKAARHLASTGAVTIGITGSYGKTTTKENLFIILSQKFRTAKTEANMNTDAGVALSILKNVKADTEYFIAEMGAYKKGEIKSICEMVRPTYGIITAIGNQHLDLFGSMENLIRAKKELLDFLPENGKAFVNAQGQTRDRLVAGVKPQVIFIQDTGISSNIETCIAVARALGLEESLINKGVEMINHLPQRLSPDKGYRNSLIIDNSYSTNKQGLINTIRILHAQKRKKKIIVTRGIIELGKEKKSTYAQIADSLRQVQVLLFTTDSFFDALQSPFIRVFDSEHRLEVELLKEAGDDCIIAFEGRYNMKTITKLKNV